MIFCGGRNVCTFLISGKIRKIGTEVDLNVRYRDKKIVLFLSHLARLLLSGKNLEENSNAEHVNKIEQSIK